MRALIYILFVASGVSGLIYEIVWLRKLALVFGSTVQATSAVLTAFMGGLALGSFALGRLADKHPAPLKLYAQLEVGIALSTAVAMLGLLPAMDGVYVAIAHSFGDPGTATVIIGGGAGIKLVRFVMAVVLLIVPTTLMGGTLPVMTRFLVRASDNLGTEIGRLYALNTLGAMAGCALAGFVLIRSIGETATVAVAVVNNLAVAAVALLLTRAKLPEAVRPKKKKKKKSEPTKSNAAPIETAPHSPRSLRIVLVAFGFAGFASLAFEVVWARALSSFMGSHVYSFTAILTTFLFGITAGSAVAARFVDRIRHLYLAFGLAEIALGILALATIPLTDRLASISDQIVVAAQGAGLVDNLFALKTLFQFSAAFVVFIGPTFLMGAVFPVVNKLYDDNIEALGRKVGDVYSVNTLGTIVGSAAGGFVLLPVLGVAGSVVAVSMVNLIIGVVVAFLDLPSSRRVAVGGAIAALAAASAAVALGLYRPRTSYLASPEGDAIMPYVAETPIATLYVREFKKERNLWGHPTRKLCINHACTAHTTFRDVTVHKMLAHLPLLLHRDPKKALVIGFGLGSTSYSMLRHPDVKVDCAELIEEEIETAPFFANENHGIIGSHPRFRLFIDDGRNFVLATKDTYDVISVNAVDPRYSPALYTKEYFEQCADKMPEDGLMALWLPTYGMSPDAHRSIYKSFSEVFGHSFVFYANQSHFVVIGSPSSIDLDIERIRSAASHPDVAGSLAEVALDDPEVLLSMAILDPAALATVVRGAPSNSDLAPIVEFDREETPSPAFTAEFFGEVARNLTDITSRLTPSDGPSTDRIRALNRQLQRWVSGQVQYYGGKREAGMARMFEALAMDSSHHFLNALTATYGRSDLHQQHFTAMRGPFRATISSALRRNPAFIQIHDLIATTSALLGDFDAALYHRTQAAKARPDDSQYAYSMGLDLLNLQRTDQARAHFEAMAARGGAEVWGRLGLAVLADDAGDSAAARRELAAALAIDPDFAEATELLSKLR